MKKLVIYYSWSGHTKKLAEELASQEQADLYEVKEARKRGTLKAYTVGSLSAMSMKRSETEPITAELGEYDRIIVLAPVWAGYPAPAINNVFDLLPHGKEVEVRLVSASGRSRAADKVRALIRGKGCQLAQYQDVKA